MTFVPNPEAERLSNLADNFADGLLYGPKGPFARLGRLALLRDAYRQAEWLDASRAYLMHFAHALAAVEVLDGGRRRMSLREARRVLDHDVPRMSGAASWPGYRAQMGLSDTYPKSVSDTFFERHRPNFVPVGTDRKIVSTFANGDRVLHRKFGYGVVAAIEGDKLLVGFDEAGEKKVIDTFVEKA